MTSITVNIGGEGDQVEIPLTIKGCACRAEDFQMALIAFTKQWKKDADKRVQRTQTQPKPCGCKDK